MFTKRSLPSGAAALILLIIFILPFKESIAQTVQRIGVFDSRAVVLACYNSKFSTQKEIFNSLGTQMKEAKEKDDKESIAKLEREAGLRQAMLHEQGFGTGSINNIIEPIKDKIAKLAEEQNLSVVVSKWELLFNTKDCEIIDVTEQMVNFFEPTDKIKSMVKEIMQTEPLKEAYLIED